MSTTQEDIELYAPKLMLIRHVGALIFWFQKSYFYRGEPAQLKTQLTRITVQNLIFGWWSIVSVFINPAITGANWQRFSEYEKEYAKYQASPEQYIFEAKQAAEAAQAKAARHAKPKLWLKIFATVIIVIVVLVIIGTILDQ